MNRSAKIQETVDLAREELLEAVSREEPLVVVKAPPGSGKTKLIVDSTAFLRSTDARVAIAAQTNSQANDICRRLVGEFPFDVTRFYGSVSAVENLGPRV